ncbi:hypothetical protein ACFYM0_02760 [Streptomyces sp. NPDC006487]|uniref:hypothetical protein n=1 Tax=Streptomyces sp. NPDC006487 TaxID=3364748 RepID=UPI0036C262AC
MDERDALDAADRAEFSLLWLDHSVDEKDCAGTRRALLSIARCMAEMGDTQTAAELRALAARHGAPVPRPTPDGLLPRPARGVRSRRVPPQTRPR